MRAAALLRAHFGSAGVAAIVAIGAPPIATSAVAQSTEAARPPVQPIAQDVAEAAQRFGIPESWIYAVMHVESDGGTTATSLKGAVGLMQVMPSTYAALRVRYRLGPNAYDPHDNIMAGAAFLREMYDRYGAPGFLAAYNAGPGRYEEYLGGRPLPIETRAYLTRLQPQIGGDADARAADLPDPLAWTRASLFAGRWSRTMAAADAAAATPANATSTSAQAVADTSADGPPASLFIPLSGQRR